jgi:hypothetical protein
MLSALTFINQQESITYCADCTCISLWFLRKTSIFPTEILKLTPRNKSPCWKANSSSASPEIPRILSHPKVTYPLRDSPQLIPVLSPVQSSPLSPVRFNILFNPLNAELNPICHLLILLGDLTFMVSASSVYPTRCNVTQFIYIWKLFYMFRVVLPLIIRSAYNCIYSSWFVTPLLLSDAIVEELEPVWVCCGWRKHV